MMSRHVYIYNCIHIYLPTYLSIYMYGSQKLVRAPECKLEAVCATVLEFARTEGAPLFCGFERAPFRQTRGALPHEREFAQVLFYVVCVLQRCCHLSLQA